MDAIMDMDLYNLIGAEATASVAEVTFRFSTCETICIVLTV